jgi:hypothetical protein
MAHHMLSFTDKFFLDASTTITIETALKNIATAKGVGNSSQDALQWLANTNQDWLLFYDNADDPEINLNQFLPRCNRGNIIITSRNPEHCVYAGAHSAVSDMDETDAVALLLKSAAQQISPANEKIAAEIVKVSCHLFHIALFEVMFQRNCATFLWQLFRLEPSSHSLESSTVIWITIQNIGPNC